MTFINKNFKEIYLSVFVFLSFCTNYRLKSLPVELSDRILQLPIGLSEIFFIPIFIYCIYLIFLKQSSIIKFPNESYIVIAILILILFFMLVSMNLSLLNNEYKHVNMLHNILAFIYLNCLIFTFIVLNPNYKVFIKFFIYFSFFITTFFFVYSFYYDQLFERQLFYANTTYRCLFTKNHHQIAFFSSILIFLSVFMCLYEKKIFYIFPIFLFSYLLYLSESNGNIASVILSISFCKRASPFPVTLR